MIPDQAAPEPGSTLESESGAKFKVDMTRKPSQSGRFAKVEGKTLFG